MNEEKKPKEPSPGLRKADRWILKISRVISYLVAAALLAIMVLAFCDVIAAKFFKTAIPSATEWITYLNVLAVFPAVAFVQLDRGHTNVDFLNHYYPKWLQKGIRVFGHLLGVGVSFVIAWKGFETTASMLAKHEMSSSSTLVRGAFPLWPFCGAMSVCCVLLGLAFAWCIVREFTGLPLFSPPPGKQEPEEPEPPAEEKGGQIHGA